MVLATGMHGLERERRVGILILCHMNGLLLIVNFIDITWIRVGFEAPEGFNLKQFVREGTWLLVLSIVLSVSNSALSLPKEPEFPPKCRNAENTGAALGRAELHPRFLRLSPQHALHRLSSLALKANRREGFPGAGDVR